MDLSDDVHLATRDVFPREFICGEPRNFICLAAVSRGIYQILPRNLSNFAAENCGPTY